jgi:GNAT superfamily N-acetyltransferase
MTTRTGTEPIATWPISGVPGVRFRGLRKPDDYPGMAAANQATRESAGRASAITTASLALAFDHFVNFDPGRDLLIVERAERIIGYARVSRRDRVDGRRSFVSICILRPEERGQGIGQVMLDWVDGRIATIAAGLPDHRPSDLDAYTWGDDVQGAALLTRNGWTERGRGYEMLISNLDHIPDVPIPDGLTIRDVDASDRRRVWDASIEAFRDHRMEPEMTDLDWQRFVHDERQDPRLWLIGFDGDEVAGGALGLIDDEENRQQGRLRGVVDEVFTRRPWRRRGLARALVARCLLRLRDRGMTSALLEVDGLNPHQAMTLYESLGFEIASVEIDWTRPFGVSARQEEVER